jgi:hypothetical protein
LACLLPEEVQAFLADDSECLFPWVDRLLASPRYGESGDDTGLTLLAMQTPTDWMRTWFTRTHIGIATTSSRPLTNKPYNQFILEQLAGDLLPGTSDENTIYECQTATGFLSLGGKMLAEDDPVKMQMDIVDEQIDTGAPFSH